MQHVGMLRPVSSGHSINHHKVIYGVVKTHAYQMMMLLNISAGASSNHLHKQALRVYACVRKGPNRLCCVHEAVQAATPELLSPPSRGAVC